ncbi:MAG: hypothetical protein ABIZ05_06435 [Pseudonocardiaceae bacterium]
MNRWIRPVEDYAGCVLLLETSEELSNPRPRPRWKPCALFTDRELCDAWWTRRWRHQLERTA